MIGLLIKVWLHLGECDPVRPSYLFFFASLGLALLSLWNGSSVFATSSSSSEAELSPHPVKSSPFKRHLLALPPPSLSPSPSSSALSSSTRPSESSSSSSTPSILSSLASRFNLSSTFSVSAFRCLAALLAFLVSVGFMSFFPTAVCCDLPTMATTVSSSRFATPASVRSAVITHLAVLLIQLCGVLAEAEWFPSVPRLFSSLSSTPTQTSSVPSTPQTNTTPATSTSERSSGWTARPTLALPAPVNVLHPNHQTRSSLREAK